MNFIDPKTAYTILHLFGVAMGAGGAYMSDIMFLSCLRDRVFSKTEIRFLKIGSGMVWTGLLILFLSGFGMFTLDPGHYVESSKFLAKMIIVGVITLNGAIMHTVQMPLILRHQGGHFPSSDEFVRKTPLLLIGGAISIPSWTFAIVLGALRGLPYSIGQILLVYAAVLVIAITTALVLKNTLFFGSSSKKK